MFCYREAPPPTNLRSVVNSFWEFSVAEAAGGPIPHEIIPDGCVAISVGSDAEPHIRVVGPRIESLTVPVWGGQVFRGVRLEPAAGYAVLGRAPATLRDLVLELGDVAPALDTGLRQTLAECRTFEDVTHAFAQALRASGEHAAPVDDAIARAAAFLIAKDGAVPIPEAAAVAGLGVRQFERRFQAAIGLTPKQFARVRRVRATAKHLVFDDPNWAELAVAMGFADQSHMTREFGSTTGGPPKRFEALARSIDYGKLIE